MENNINLVISLYMIRDNYQFQTNEKKGSEKIQNKQCDVTFDFLGYSITLRGIGLRHLVCKRRMLKGKRHF